MASKYMMPSVFGYQWAKYIVRWHQALWVRSISWRWRAGNTRQGQSHYTHRRGANCCHINAGICVRAHVEPPLQSSCFGRNVDGRVCVCRCVLGVCVCTRLADRILYVYISTITVYGRIIHPFRDLTVKLCILITLYSYKSMKEKELSKEYTLVP